MSTVYQVSPALSNDSLNALFAAAWDNHTDRNHQPVLDRSLLYVCAYAGETLVGFVNVAWDGGIHAFILDTTVHKDWQRRGIGRELVVRAADEAKARDIEWLHVDYEPHLDNFYRACGFQHTMAGLMRLSE